MPNGVITTRVSFIVAEQRVNGGELAQRNTFLFFTGSRNVAVLILCSLLSLKETVILFGLATQIVALLVLLALSRSITSMEVLLWMVVIEVVWAVYFVVTECWHDKLASKAMLTV